MNPAPQETSEGVDDDLMAAVATGDGAALDRLMLRHQAGLYRFVLHCTNDAALSADIVQETFVRVWTSGARRFRPGAGTTAKTWLFTIALNLVRDNARRHGRFARFLERFTSGGIDPVETGNPSDDADGPGESADRQDRLQALTAAMTKLPEKLRLPLVMCVLEGMPQEEAARVLGTSRKSVEMRIRRAKEGLRLLLT